MKCPNCGHKIEKGQTVCPQCGSAVERKPKGRKTVAVILTVAILFGGLVTLLWQLNFFSFIGSLFSDGEEEEITHVNTAQAELKDDVKLFGTDDTNAIESAVLHSTQEGDTLILECTTGSPLESLEQGDIFLLRGFTDSAFGESYFGKLTYKYDSYETSVFAIQTPSVYEVFEDLEMDILQSLDYSTLTDFYAADGVEIMTPTAALEATDTAPRVEQLSSGVKDTADDKGIGLTLELDLLKLLKEYGKKDANKSIFREATKDEAAFVEVYVTDTGRCYHQSGCQYLRLSSTAMKLSEAAAKGLRPCSVCKPYYIEDEDHKFADLGAELTLKGSVTLTDLSFGVVGKNGKKWELKQGFENLAVETKGTLKADAKLEGNVALKFEGETTSLTVEGMFDKPFLTIEGLKEKMLPFAYCTWNGASFVVTDAPDDNEPWNAPVSVGILFYTDLYGNITIGAELRCEYTRPITKSFDIYKDGKFLGIGAEKDAVSQEASEDKSGKLTWSFKAEVSGDVTFEALGVSLMLYVGNVNLLELGVANLAAHANGAVGFDSAKMDNDQYGFYAEGDVRLYLEMFTLDMKASAEGMGGILDLEAECTLGPLIDLTIWRLNKQTERDIVLVLDASGSMSGTPIQEAKNAAAKFIQTVMDSKEDASISVVTYDNSAVTVSPLTSNKESLLSAVDRISSGGGTDIEAGLARAEQLLNERNAKKKSIVLLSDGLPNDGKTGDSLIEYAASIKDQDVYIYTLGFFDQLYDSEKVAAQQLMGAIASEGMHYEVTSADDLVFFFNDLADQISGQKYIYIRIACPVDVTVRYDGERLCSKENKLSTRTEFGTLTFEENEEEAEEDSDNRIKILRLKEGVSYEILIEGNGRGSMDYTIGFMDDEGEYSDLRTFKNVRITKRTEINTVAAVSDSTYLYVDEDGDGKVDLTYKAAIDSRGELVEESDFPVVAVLAIAAGITAAAVVTVVILMKKKKKRTTPASV